MKLRIIILLLICNLFSWAQAGQHSCVFFLSSPVIDSSQSDTESFISYINRLIDENVVPVNYLQILIENADTNSPTPNPLDKAPVQSAQSIHSSMIQMYLEHTHLDKKQIKAWAQKLLTEKQIIQNKRTEANKQTNSAFTNMKFRPIKGGFFYFGKGRYDPKFDNADCKKPITIDYDFEMTDTPITVHMWIQVMGVLPFGLKHLSPAEFDKPVTTITWWSILAFANKFSEQHQLEPAYDLNRIKFEGDAALGTLVPVDEKAAYNLLSSRLNGVEVYLEPAKDFPGLLDIDIHKKTGYRLPTAYEQEFAQSDRGRSTGPFFTSINHKNLNDVAWYIENSLSTMHSVAQRNPLIIDDQPFYDLFGNIYEYSSNCTIQSNPNGSVFWLGCRVTGGDYTSTANFFELPSYQSLIPSNGIPEAGFRLVRSLPK